MTFRAHYQTEQTGGAHFSFAEATGVGIRDLFDATDFVCQLAAASRLQVMTSDAQVILMDVQGKLDKSWVNNYRQVRGIADDVLVIEADTRTKFRYPARIDAEERVVIRNIRLMLEGNCVAHPTWKAMSAKLSGERGEDLNGLLTTDPHWVIRTSESATLALLGQDIKLKQFCIGGIFVLEPDHVREVETALKEGTVDGIPLRLRCRPGDRVRMFLGDRFDEHRPIEITPWGIEGINQKGLTAAGSPVNGRPELGTSPQAEPE